MATISSLIVNMAKDAKELRGKLDTKHLDKLERLAREVADLSKDVKSLPDTVRGSIKDSLLSERRRTKKSARRSNRKKKR